VPWEGRVEASRLLAGLKDATLGWGAVVVGYGTRCWFGKQVSLIAHRFGAYGVDLWVPELGGRFDDRGPSHKMLMSEFGGMNESERQHAQICVQAAMDAASLRDVRRHSRKTRRTSSSQLRMSRFSMVRAPVLCGIET
jgi:hypothetical protein